MPANAKTAAYEPRMRALYNTKIRGDVKKAMGFNNDMQIPKLEKIVLNMGVGKASQDKKILESALSDMRAIAGQQPVITRARKSIAGFKIREGMAIGCKVTLRGARMYDFLDRLVTVALPRVRDFQGISEKSFDGNGNYALGVKEQIIFQEIDYDKIDQIRGLDIVISTTARDDKAAFELLKGFGLPFKKKEMN